MARHTKALHSVVTKCILLIVMMTLFSRITTAETENTEPAQKAETPCETRNTQPLSEEPEIAESTNTENTQKDEATEESTVAESVQKEQAISLAIDCSASGPIHYTKVNFIKDGKSEQNMRSCEKYLDILTSELKDVPKNWEQFNADLVKGYREKQCGPKYWCQLGTANLCHMKAPFRFERGFNDVKQLHQNVVNGLTQGGWCK